MTKKTLKSVVKDIPKPSRSRSVNIEEASNGFTVSSWMGDKQIRYIAKTKKEAVECAIKIFNKP